MNFDTPTMLVVTSILCIGMSLSMILVWRFVLSERALLLWGIAQGCFAVGMILMMQRGTLPDFITIIVANSFNLGCYALIWWAACNYRHRPPPIKTLVALFVIFLASYIYYTYVELNIEARIAIMHILMPMLMVGSAATLMRPRDRKIVKAELIAGLAFLLDAVFRLVILGLHFTNVDDASPLPRNQAIAITVLLTIVSFSAWGLAVIMMVLDGVTRQLAGANKLLQSVLDAIPVRVFWKDRDSRYLGCNRNFAADTGLPSSEVIPGMTDNDMAWRALAENYLMDDRQVITSGKPKLHYEESFILPDGRLARTSTSKVPLYDAQNQVIGIVGAYEDITERKKAEEALNLFKLTLDQTLDCIFMFRDDNFRFVYVNEGAIKQVGYTHDELLGMSPLDIKPEFTLERFLKMVQPLQDGTQPSITFDTVHRHKDGHDIPVEIFLQLVRNEGAESRYIAIVRDITERKQAEQELQRSNAELEQFSYAISHDMRQPLRMISSYLQLLEKSLAGQLDDGKQDYFNFAIDGAKRLDQMLLALLEYSRVGRRGEPPMWVESRALLDEALLFLQPAIAEAQAELHISGDWPQVFVSRDEMMRLIQNLIGNAVKYHVAGRTPEITVSSETVGKEWHLSVTDNGVGILPSQIGRLFQVFQRLHTRAAYEGTGIGLALCRKIAEHHGGQIGASSPGEGLGSTFWVKLPSMTLEAPANRLSAHDTINAHTVSEIAVGME